MQQFSKRRMSFYHWHLTEQQIKELLSGKTVTVKGMKAGDGRTFSAGVFMGKSGRLELVRNKNGQSRR